MLDEDRIGYSNSNLFRVALVEVIGINNQLLNEEFTQKKQFIVNIKMFQRCEVIIFVWNMLARGYFLLTGFALIIGWTAVALGFNMPFTWFANHSGPFFLDNFFIHFSWLAEWTLIVVALSVAIITDWKRGIWMSVLLGIQALTVAGIKFWINAPRPIEINADLVRRIPNLDIHHWQAFPSGHTAVGFFTMGLLAICYPKSFKGKRFVYLFLAMIAIGTGYARMYLAQHSLIDVCGGGTLALLFLQFGHRMGTKLNIHE